MNPLAVNLLLAIAWAALVGSFTLASLALGFGLGYFALWVARPLFGSPVFRRFPALAPRHRPARASRNIRLCPSCRFP